VTSAAYSPARQRIIGLGYVHRDAATIGARLAVGDPPRETIEIVGFAG
jgi:glycine cleavage system aminomethyltransferase T